MKTPHKHSDAIKAWADGATIEYLDSDGNWVQPPYPPNWSHGTKYRVKPAEKFQVLAYKPTTDVERWTENKLTFQLDPTATQWSLGRTDGEGDRLFLFDTYADADAACQAVNKSLTNF